MPSSLLRALIRVLVIMPRSPTIIICRGLERAPHRVNGLGKVFGSPVFPANTCTATGRPSWSVSSRTRSAPCPACRRGSSRRRPVHRDLDAIGRGTGHAQIRSQCHVVPPGGRGQLGGRAHHPGDDQRIGKIPAQPSLVWAGRAARGGLAMPEPDSAVQMQDLRRPYRNSGLVGPCWIESPSTDIPRQVSTSAKSHPGFPQREMAIPRMTPVTAIVGTGGDGDAR